MRSVSRSTLATLQRLVRRVDPAYEVLGASPLGGGVSARVTLVEVRGVPEQAERLVVREYGQANASRDALAATHEFQLLHALRGADLRVPTPRLADDSRATVPAPVLVTDYIDARPDFTPRDPHAYATQLARFLLRLHAASPAPLAFLPRAAGPGPAPDILDESLSEGRIRGALARAWPPEPANPPAVLHGDFWPGNTLWRDGQLVSVIDWEDAAIGDPLADVANARLELLFFHGSSVMQVFTDAYRSGSRVRFGALPGWDLLAALRPCGRMQSWALDPDRERSMRKRHAWFVERALARFGGA